MLSRVSKATISTHLRAACRKWSASLRPQQFSTGVGLPMTDYESRDLTGRRIMVTGANRGMGLELSKQLAERGARVIAVGRDEAAIHEAAESITGVQHSVEPRVADCGDRHSIKSMMQALHAEHGHLDGLVLNASIMPGFMQPVFGVDDELEEQTFRINVEGYWFCVKYAMPLLLASPTDFERTVVFVSGLAGALEKPVPGLGMLPYSATLAAENGLMVRLHQEMVDDNAGAVQLRGGSKERKDKLQRVVSLHPGIVATGLGRETMEGGSVEEITQNKAKTGHFVDIKTGVDTMTWLMAAKDGVVQSGKFYDQRKVIPF